MSLNDWENRMQNKPVRTTFGMGFWTIMIILGLTVVGGAGFWAINLASQPAKIVEKTLDVNNVLYNYEWFRQQYADIGGMQPKIDNAVAARTAFEQSAGDRSTWKNSDRQEWDRLNAIVLGLQNSRISMIQDYNAKASMANKSLFINPPLGGVELPDHVDL